MLPDLSTKLLKIRHFSGVPYFFHPTEKHACKPGGDAGCVQPSWREAKDSDTCLQT